MLLFRSEDEVEAWCRATGESHGETLPLPQVWTLAQAWYGDRMHPDFRRRSITQALEIFRRVELRSDFWQLVDNP
jgi:hypothetical protein